MLKIGVEAVDITSPLGVELCGYGFYLKRKAKGIHDSLHGKILILEDRGERYLYLNCELIALGEDLVEEIRQLIAEEAKIKEKNIIFSCTHTHSGPATAILYGCGEIDEKYLSSSSLPEQFLRGVNRALKKMKKAKIGFAKTTSDLSYNRTKKDGIVDRQVMVAKIDTEEDKPLAILFNYACHAVCLGRKNFLISADFPGFVCRKIEETTGAKAFFLQGACGDIDPKGGPCPSFENAEKYGKILADTVLEVLPKIETNAQVNIDLVSRKIKLPLVIDRKALMEEAEEKISVSPARTKKFYQNWKRRFLKKLEENISSETSAEIQVLSVNDACFFFLPGEVFTKFGLEIKSGHSFNYNFIVGYSNGIIGYIPDKDDFKRKGYAASLAPKIYAEFPFQDNVGEILVNEALNLSREKYGKISH